MNPQTHLSIEHLSAHLDGEGAVSARTVAHLAACLTCARRFEALRRTREAVRTLPRPAIPAAVERRLRAALGSSPPRRRTAWLEALQPRRVLAPLCAILMVAVGAVTYLETEARARASTIARESLERALAANRFEAMLDGPSPTFDRLVGQTWLEPGLATVANHPVRRLSGSSREAKALLSAHADARRAFDLPGVEAVRLRAGGGPVEITRATEPPV